MNRHKKKNMFSNCQLLLKVKNEIHFSFVFDRKGYLLCCYGLSRRAKSRTEKPYKINVSIRCSKSSQKPFEVAIHVKVCVQKLVWRVAFCCMKMTCGVNVIHPLANHTFSNLFSYESLLFLRFEFTFWTTSKPRPAIIH